MALLATAAVTSSSLNGMRRERVATEAARLATDAGRRLRDALAVQTEALVLLSSGAASNSLLLTALRGGVDGQTLADIAGSEAWWAPYRDAAAAVSYDGTHLAFSQDADSPALTEAMVAAVRDEGRAVVRILAGNGRVRLMAGDTIPLAHGRAPAVLVLSRPLDGPALQALAARVGAPVLLVDARGVLAAGGSPEERALLRPALGREKETVTPRPTAGDGSFAAVAVPLSPSLWAWTGAGAKDFARVLAASDARKRRALWVIATLAAAGTLVVTWRRRPLRASSSGGDLALPALGAGDGVPQGFLNEGGSASGSFSRALTAGSGAALGRYLLLERIGEGGMAEVFAAVSFGANGFRRFFVIKRLRPEMASNPTAVAHFIDEANLASTLVHPNIVPVFDFGEIAGIYYIAQEYVVGRDLGRLTRRMAERGEPPLSLRAMFFLTHELLAALEYAHDRRDDDGSSLDIVHRDVTPENVMLSERGEVKLLDFGIVKTAQGRLARTEIGHVKGNVDFMAPEQARGRPVDRRADLFSVGLVLYYAAAGAPLYQGDTLYDRLNRAATGPGPEEMAKVALLPAPLPEILQRALAVNADERYQCAADFRAVLAPLGEGGEAELAAAIARNFARDLQAEHERLTTAFPRSRSTTPEMPAAPPKAGDGDGEPPEAKQG
jgi:serine/threonine protein kinase